MNKNFLIFRFGERVNLKQILAVIVLGATSGLLVFAIMNTFEHIRGFYVFLITSLIVSLALITAYNVVTGSLGKAKTFMLTFLAVFTIALITFTLYLGFALMPEQEAYLFVERIKSSDGCIQVSDEELSKISVLWHSLKKAEKKGKVIVEIDPGYVSTLSDYYSRCVIYNGSAYKISVAVS